MSTREIETTCPSGLRCRLRGLKGREINLFANKTEAQQRKIGYDLLSSLVLEVQDPGPMYPGAVDDGAAMDWRRVVAADRFWLYLQMRVATYGDDYVFRFQCGGCRKRFDWGLKISSLGMKPIPDESIQTFFGGNVFGPVRASGCDVKFRLVTGEMEDRGVKLAGLKPEEADTIGIAMRIESIDGDDSRGRANEWVKDADMLDLMDLVDQMDEADGGVDTDLDLGCPHCGRSNEVNLPLGEDFWTPDKHLRSLMRKVSVTDERGGGPILQR